MASKRRLRLRSCEKKRKHSSQLAAIKHARRLRQMMNIDYEAYQCPFCHQWHVGRPNRKQIRAKQQHLQSKWGG